MQVICCLIVLVGVISTSLSKDIVDRHDVQSEEQAGLFEGDIRLTPEQKAIIEEAKIADKDGLRKAISDLTRRWPNAVVPYVNNGADNVKVNQAIAHWEDKTCVTFVARNAETDYVEFITGNGCWSYIGKIGGKQQVSIGNGCSWGNAAHEIGHVIGFWHEHSRPDRDQYIVVNLANINPDKRGNFDIHNDIVTHGVAYDVGSIMHYGENFFSINGQNTITAIDPADQDSMGQRDGLSDQDVLLAIAMYRDENNCQNVCPSGWVSRLNRCYSVLNTWQSFESAQNACEQLDGSSYIAVANDEAENVFLAETAADYIWLGCNAKGGSHLWTCPDSSGKTFDATTGTASPANSYWNWDVYQPEVNDEQCQVQYVNGENIWHSWPCSSDFKAVCELPSSLLVCPPGWIANGDSCYKVIETWYTYEEAESACQQLDARSYVAVANDETENVFIAETAPDYIWLGCNAKGGNHLWTCPDGSGKTFDANTGSANPANSYWNWDAYQPEVNNEQCQVQYIDGSYIWHSWPCSSDFQVVCEISEL